MATLSASFAAVCILLICSSASEGAEWSYTGSKGVNFWATNFRGECDGQQQSPINLDPAQTMYDSNLQPFTFSGFDSTQDVTWSLSNNGHTAQVTYTAGNLTVSGGSLGATYNVLQFHFHWGSVNSQGSEHTKDGAAYPMEVHIVCFKATYNVSYALTQADGLAVLGFFFEIGNTDHPAIQNLVTKLPEIMYSGSAVSITPFPLTSMLAGTDRYFRYSGGLTTPTCNEVVTWTVFDQAIVISQAQMDAFRALKDSANVTMVDNYRPVQALYSRQIKANFQDAGFGSSGGSYWAYNGNKGVDYWATNYPGQCDGQQQSPINLEPSKISHDSALAAFTFTGFDSADGVQWTLSNNGHTVQVTYTAGDLTVSGGSLGATYKVQQFHFHWGANNARGSEHTKYGAAYPMEVHIVCSKSTYNLSYALTQSDGLAVLGFFFQIADSRNPTIQKLVDHLPHVRNSGDAHPITPFPLTDMLAGTDRYFRYSGGLTTPTCNEVVTWTVFDHAIKISQDQMNAFRGLLDSHNHTMVDNYRPVQKLYTREIKASFSDTRFFVGTSASARLALPSLALVSCLLLALIARM